MNPKLLALYGLKWNPFAPDVPVSALLASPKIDTFCWRVESLAREGGFALVTGDPGLGKSVALRLLVEKLSTQRELTLGLLSRPQARLQDFYRELGDLFDVQLAPHNRWSGTRLLRERWQAHIESSLLRPVLVIDEAQEMMPSVLNELRLLCAVDLDDQRQLLFPSATTILPGPWFRIERDPAASSVVPRTSFGTADGLWPGPRRRSGSSAHSSSRLAAHPGFELSQGYPRYSEGRDRGSWSLSCVLLLPPTLAV